jgi:hypothetical protein
MAEFNPEERAVHNNEQGPTKGSSMSLELDRFPVHSDRIHTMRPSAQYLQQATLPSYENNWH